MSIHDVIKSLVNKDLFLLTSELLGEDTPRTIYYSNEVREIVDGANCKVRNKNRFASAKAVMDAFIELGEITFGLDPFEKDHDAIMARTEPSDWGIIDFRVLDPTPGIRVLGGFSEPDTFIALTWCFREDMDFDAEVSRSRGEWNKMFPGFEPQKGANVNAYITENYLTV